MDGHLVDDFARECEIRDHYASQLSEHRSCERLIRTEPTFAGSSLRADMKTVDASNVLRVWEFKIHADYRGLGQVLTYLALERLSSPGRQVRAVLAAFTFSTEITQANEILNLGIEMITLPPKLQLAGKIPTPPGSGPRVPFIPAPLQSPK